ncbi:MAG: hypothetical protein IJ909_09330 [Fibrobacter sp.]|nr:hypothetical protein [Fibrobacter sp.]
MKNFRKCHCETLWVVTIALLFLAGCSLYDNYDIDLMNDGNASIDSSSDAADSGSSLSSSSTEEVSSSSEAKDIGCEETVERGGVTYATVVIHEDCWMAENLRYEPVAGNTMCYDNDDANCDTYGLLYDYAAAAAACPKGWRLPTSAEYEALQAYSGSNKDEAGAHFKTTTGWKGENGDNKLKFSALPGGFCFDEGEIKCKFVGSVGYWWTSTEKIMDESHVTLYLSGDRQDFTATLPLENENMLSVRCIKDK